MEDGMSMLDQELCDEWLRCQRALEAHRAHVADDCPRGYLSHKVIRGRDAWYLQWRDGARVRSRYVRACDVEAVAAAIADRKSHEASARRVEDDMRRIERVVGRERIELYRKEMGL